MCSASGRRRSADPSPRLRADCCRSTLDANLLAGSSLDSGNLGSQENLNPLVVKQFEERGPDVRVLTAGESSATLDHRHARAEPARCLCQLEANVPTAHHDEMIGDTLQVEHFDMRHRLGVSQSRHLGNRRARADAQDDTFARDRSRAPVVEIDDNGLRSHEARLTHDQVHAAGFVPPEMDLDEILDHLPFPPLNAPHIRRGRTDLDSEL